MEQRTAALGVTTVAAVAITAAALRTPAPPAAREVPAAAVAGDSARSAATRGAAAWTFSRGAELVQRFFGGTSVPFDTSRYDFDVLIATLPDPFDSHLDWSFDTGLEAIRRAFESSGYLVDGFWLPPRDSLDPPDGRARMARREFEPGVMLFRSTDERARRLRLVYLIPEVPTSGIYKDALATAFVERDRLFDTTVTKLPLRIDSSRPTRIIGPIFSGSSLSLQLALRRHIKRGNRITIVSGSATSLGNLETLTCDTLGIRFSATINPDQSLREVLDATLDSLRIPGSQVAVLQESSTQYGQSVLAEDTATKAKTAVCGGRLPRRSSETPDDFLVIPFPMSISSLRSEFQRLPPSPTVGGVPGATSTPRLPLDLIDPVRSREDLPVTSRLTPPALDLILDEVARTLRRHHIRMVGLLATDVRDKLFLGKEVKQRMRDVQFFTFESNVLYLRPDHSSSLRGMLVFSTYPLLLEHHAEVRDKRHLAFASEGAQGIYNATLMQLENRLALRDYGPVDSAGVPIGRPPVWITTVGNQLFLPVKADSGVSAKCYVEPAKPDTMRSSCPASYGSGEPENGGTGAGQDYIDFLPFASTTLVAVALVVLAVASVRRRHKPWVSLAPIGLVGPNRHLWNRVQRDSLRIHERLYNCLRLIAALAAFVVAAVPLVLLSHEGPVFHRILTVALILSGVAGIVVLIICGVQLQQVARRAWPTGRRFMRSPEWGTPLQHGFWYAEVAGRLLVALWGLFYLALSVWFGISVWRIGQGGLANAEMFLLRAGAVDSLVSPLLPLIVAGAGFALWAWWHLRRVALLQDPSVFECVCAEDLAEACRSASPVCGALHGDLRRAARAVEQVRIRLFLLLPSAGALILFGVLAVFVVWIWPQFGATIESLTLSRWLGLSSFDWLFRISILASFAAIAWATFRLLAVWQALRHCLGAIRAMPLLPAFERLPAQFASAVRLAVPGPKAAAEPELVADQQWVQLTKIYEVRRPEILTTFASGDLTAKLDRLMSYSSARRFPRDSLVLDLEAKRFRELHEILCDLWEREPGADGIKAAAGELKDAPLIAKPGSDTSGKLRRTFAGAAGLWRRAAEEYAASVIVDYLQWAMRHLYVLALFLLFSLLLMTALLSSYPFQPQGLLKLVFFFLLLLTVGSMMLVLLQANRDEVLSRINQTEPGRVTWNLGFITSVFTIGLVPLVTLLTSEFPALRDAVFSWVEPLIKLVARQ